LATGGVDLIDIGLDLVDAQLAENLARRSREAAMLPRLKVAQIA